MVDVRALSQLPVVVAPMSGGPSTPDLVASAGRAGALAFLAAGYKTADAMVAEITTVRAASTAPFGVNLFVPQPSTADPARLAAYVASLDPDARRRGTRVGEPRWADDDWDAKIAYLLDDPPAVVSFTFAVPPPPVVAAFRARGTVVIATVTTPGEARLAAALGADALCAQGSEAGGHRGTFTNDEAPPQDIALHELVEGIRATTDLPVIAAGGIADAMGVSAALAAGAVAAQVGTAFLRCPESGTRAAHRAALVDPQFTETAITRAFTGRRARGLVNVFMRDHPDAPPAYPEIHYATAPLRAAAAEADDADGLNLWAGTSYRQAPDAPVGDVLAALVTGG